MGIFRFPISGLLPMLFKVPMLGLIRCYQFCISPLFPPCCRFTPSCSQYAAEAIELHGPLRGGRLALWRLLRCNPFTRGGLDPVMPISTHKIRHGN